MPKHLKYSTALVAALLTTSVHAQGFVLSLDGETVVGDTAVEKRVERVEVRLAAADVQITYDGADPVPELQVRVARQGAGWVFTSASNYPAYIARGEVRLIDQGAAGGPRLIAVAPLSPNAQTVLPTPDAIDPVVVYRVYDARGRFDETAPQRFDGAAEGGDLAPVVSNIRVRGGAVQVTAADLAQGARLQAFGETVRPDPSGRVLLERILPSGMHAVDVAVIGGPTDLSFGRDIEIDASDWFYVVVADATLWAKRDGETGERYAENLARLQFYVAGETEGGVEVAASLDTGEGDIRDIFRSLDEKDPRAVAQRLLTENAHVTYGDDSTSQDLTPTSGRVYVRVAKGESYGVWGDYQAQISGSDYLRNERNLYGAQLHLETAAVTARGDARATVDAFAAQPDQLLGRDVFRGTGGSVYFLSRQDIAAGTAVLHVVFRDSVTGRVIERLALAEGADYQVNALQGVVTLAAPLSGSSDRDLITTAGGDTQISLEVQYEYTPISITGAGLTAGARVEAWITDDLRFGATYLRDDSGTADQTAQGIDLRYLIGANSHVQLDYARSTGPGYDSLYSVDGGLVLDTRAASAGTGDAFKLEGKLDLADLQPDLRGAIGGYAELRREGFSTLDYQVDASTGDQRLYGFYVDQTLANGLTYGLRYDHVDNAVGTDVTTAGVEVAWPVSGATELAFAAETLRETTAGTTASRVDVAVRLTRQLGENGNVYVYGQSTVQNAGLDDNDRAGIGFERKFGQGWTVAADVSDGTTGVGIDATLAYDDGAGSTTYFGYALDPSLTYGTGISQRDAGQFVIGGTRKINEAATSFAETKFDLLGDRREMTSRYGIDVAATQHLTVGGSYTQGRVTDAALGDLSREALSLTAAYEDDRLSARARLEYRRDQEFEDSARVNTDTFIVSSDAQWKIDESQRLLFGLTSARTTADTASFLGGTFTQASIGYAYRPIADGKMNILASYRYLYDTYGQVVDGQAGEGPVQDSHILNLEGNYALNEEWTLGAKLGYRASLSAPQKGGVMVRNDAVLAVANARYHLLKDWDVLLEARHFEALDAGFSQTGALAAAYKQINRNLTVGVGYNFSTFSDDLGDLTFDDEGLFLNIVAAY
mgnify:CR=1 FL=1